jgi:hypothetical protein
MKATDASALIGLALTLALPTVLATPLDSWRDAAAAFRSGLQSPAPGENNSDGEVSPRNSEPPVAALARRCPAGGMLPPVGVRPEHYKLSELWPENYFCSLRSFADLRFETARAQKQAFVAASKVACKDCEGGFSYDAWGHLILVKGGNYAARFQEMLLALQPAQALVWQGRKYAGAVSLVGEQPIGPFPCRQYRWTLKDSGSVVAQRYGLICEFKAPRKAAPSWHEIL